MNIPTVIPPKKKRAFGPKPKLTPMQEIELWSWWKAKQFLGTHKQKAREMGISVTGIKSFITRMKNRERSQVQG